MNTIGNWDFSDAVINETLPQINRQKSALNLGVVSIDAEEGVATFTNTDGSLSIASRFTCDCPNFNFSGKSPRKKFAPCMHIYRLGYEMGLLKPKFLDAKGRAKIFTAHFQQVRRVDGLYRLARATKEWGGWNRKIHANYTQLLRQIRAWQIILTQPVQVANFATGIVNGYSVRPSSCSCPDFLDRGLPCKHVYALAIKTGQPLPFTEDMYHLIGGNEEKVLGYVLTFPKANEPFSEEEIEFV